MARKKRKLRSKVGIDHISNLPDNVMSQILSCLPTKDAVRTCVLSRQWKYKYTFISNIHIDDYNRVARYSSFRSFMETLLTHDDDSVLRSRSVVLSSRRGRNRTKLPGNLLRCVSLTKLKLSLKCALEFRDNNCFPNLKSLYLEKVEVQNKQISKEGLLSLTFPALEFLETRCCKFLEAKNVAINAPQLITFICGFECQETYFTIEIEGPKLVEFTLSNGYKGYIDARAPELQFVALENQWDHFIGWPNSRLLTHARRLKCLRLSAENAKVLVKSIKDYVRAFVQIRRLEIGVDIHALLKLVQAMPCLEFLKLNMLDWHGDVDEQEQESIRLCFASHSHLKEIELINFLKQNNQLHLINLLLENGKSLERVTVCSGESVFSEILNDVKKLGATRVHGDLISSLPDDVISHILSRLPTKDAVRTSVLSRQWKHMYASVYNIDIEVGGMKCESCVSSPSVRSFINRLLTHDSNIISFRVVSREERRCLHHSTKWIPRILNHKVQNLVLDFCSVKLIECFAAGSASLTTLNISMNGFIQFPVENCFPNLKSLYLSSHNNGTVQIQNELLIFPALEVLEMRECAFRKVKLVEIIVPELITFKYEYSEPEREGCEIKIFGPKVTKLHYSCGDLSKHVPYVPFSVTRNLHSGSRSSNQQTGSQIIASRASALLNGAPSLTCLTLSRVVAEALVEWKNVHVVPAFDQVKRLEICCDAETLLELLQKMPFLESLKLNIPSWHGYWHRYIADKPLPLCIAPCLKKVEFIYFYGGSRQMDLIKLFVENVNCLERVTVCLGERPRDSKNEITRFLETLLPSISEKEIREQLTTLKQANSSCAIVFK